MSLTSKYLNLEPRTICELSLVNLSIWQDFDRPKEFLINENLCILISPANEPPFFLEPLGNHKLEETVAVCLKQTGVISRASEQFVRRLSKKNYRFKCLRNQFDYVYLTKELAELKGKKYDAKRNHIKRFKHRFPEYKFVPLTLKLKTRALRLFEIWFEKRKESRYFPKLAYDSQKKALENAFANFERLKLLGGALFAGGELRGFTLGSYLNKETIAVHFMYADPHLQGSAQILLWEASNRIYQSATFINLEQDLGIPGLRKAKLSYHPHQLQRKFEVRYASIR